MKKTIKSVISFSVVLAMSFSMMCSSAIATETTQPIKNIVPIVGEVQHNEYYSELNRKKEERMYRERISINPSKSLSVHQYPQRETDFCGYASLQSLFRYEGKYYSMSQYDIMDTFYPRGRIDREGLAWYTIDGTSADQYPAAAALNDASGYGYAPYPCGTMGSVSPTQKDFKDRIVTTISDNHGVLACGHSGNEKSGSHLPGYPNNDVYHWITVYGYTNSGNSVLICDPAGNNTAVLGSSFKNVKATYSVDIDTFTEFASYFGIIW